MFGRGQGRQRFPSGFEQDSGFQRSNQIQEEVEETIYCSQLTTAIQPANTAGTLGWRSHKRQRAVPAYRFGRSSQQSQQYNQDYNSPPCRPPKRRVQSPDLFHNRFSPDPEAQNERHFEALVEENRVMIDQIDEGEKLMQQSERENANLKCKIAALEKRCHGVDARRVLELKKEKQNAEEKVKELVAENKSLQGEESRLMSEGSRQKAELQNILNEKMKAENEVKDARKRAIEDKDRFDKVNQQKSAELEKTKKELEKITKMHKDLKGQQNKHEQSIKEVTTKLNKAQDEVNKKDDRLKHHKELEEKFQKLEKKMNHQRLEEMSSKKQEVCVKKAAIRRSKELQVDLNRMRSQKQKQSTKLAALKKDFEKNRKMLSDAQERLKQYTDHFGDQPASEISTQKQELETMNTEVIGKLTAEVESLRGDLNRAAHDLKIQRFALTVAEVGKNPADCENSEQMRGQLQSLEAEGARLKNTIKQLEEQLETKTKELKEATDTCQTQQEELASQQTELGEHKSQLDEFKKVKIEEASELSELKNRADNLHEKLTQTEQQLSFKDEQVVNLKQELAELHHHLGNVKELVNNIHPKAQPEPNPAM